MPNSFARAVQILLFLFVYPALSAQVKLPAIISDNMVLQQNSRVALWGWASPGEKVTVWGEWNKIPIAVIADKEGKWQVTMATARAGGPYKMSFTASNTLELNNVLLGEVWLASGQSNMEFFMNKTTNASYTGVVNYQEEIAAADYPNIRQIDVPNKVADSALTDFKANWKLCTPKTADTFSAVAYYFAREIHKKTGFPIGIINATWGGTPAESWTNKSILESDPDLVPILERYKKQCEDFPAEFEKYKIAQEKWKADTSKNKGGQPPQPIGPKHNKSPYKLYNGMIVPIIPYTLKGVIWYQGESNADRAYQYRKLFAAMIEGWRKDWNNSKLPFYFVQISPHRSQNAEIRDAQLYTYHHVPYTGIVVTTDNGDSIDIHPRNKKLVGERLALWALKNDYKQKGLEVSGPLYKSMKIQGNKIVIRFDHAKSLTAKEAILKEFTIAGSDRKFSPAQAVIKNNTVEVWSDEVKQPVAVRFAWRNVPTADLFNEAGLPASPFRTDDWPLLTQDKK